MHAPANQIAATQLKLGNVIGCNLFVYQEGRDLISLFWYDEGTSEALL